MKKIISTVIAIAALAIPFSVMEASAADAKSEIQIATVSEEAGKEIDVPVEITSNEGIVAMSFTIEYDTDSLELLNVTDCGLFAEASYTQGGDIKAVPFRMMWENGLARDNYTNTGEIAILHFNVLDSAKSGFSEIKINVEADNTFDVDLEDVAFEGINGGVEIKGTEPITTTTTTETTTTSTTEITTTTETTTSITDTITTTEETTTTETITSTTDTTTTTEETTATETITSTTDTTTTMEETTAPEITTTVITDKYFASEDELCNMALEDYRQKTGTAPTKAETTTNADGTLSIVLTDENGKVLDTYIIDPVTGIGTSSDGSEVNLPQTGNNSLKTVTAASAALALTLFGSYAVVKSGILRKKEDEQ